MFPKSKCLLLKSIWQQIIWFVEVVWAGKQLLSVGLLARPWARSSTRFEARNPVRLGTKWWYDSQLHETLCRTLHLIRFPKKSPFLKRNAKLLEMLIRFDVSIRHPSLHMRQSGFKAAKANVRRRRVQRGPSCSCVYQNGGWKGKKGLQGCKVLLLLDVAAFLFWGSEWVWMGAAQQCSAAA